MNMKKKILLNILFLLLPFGSVVLAQNSFEEIKDSVIDFGLADSTDFLEIIANINTFQEQGLDSTDIEMLLSGPILGTLIVELAQEDKLTYQNLCNEYIKFKQTSLYLPCRTNHEITKKLASTSADYSNWNTDKELFLALNIPDKELESIRLYVQKHSDSQITYSELLEAYEKEKQAEKIAATTFLFEFQGAIDIDSLKTLSLEKNKPILLYFTGYNCVNCRRLEVITLSERIIYTSLLEDFIFASLYIDSRMELPEEEQYMSDFNQEFITTVGSKNLDYLISNFEVSSQPYFVCLNSGNQILETADYQTNSIDDFVDFLESCIKKFNN